MVAIANFQFPIADCRFEQQPIGNEKSRAKQRGTSIHLKFLGPSSSDSPMLFSRLFYVAASRLNSPRFSMAFIRPSARACQVRKP
jgi:hypothetical protein